MSHLVHHTNCPVCRSHAISNVLIAKDHTVSGEEFAVWHCDDCSFRFTQDAPPADAIGRYYQSENYISHSNTSKGLVNRLYQAARKKTLRSKRKLLQHQTGLEKGNLLDVGSGTGAFVNEMSNSGWSVTGLEPDAGARKLAKELYGIELQETTRLFELPPGSFDSITLWHVLEHVHELAPYLHQLKALLKEKGVLFIAVPNYTSIDAAVYKEHWAAYDVPRHLWHFSPASIKKLVEDAGMKIMQYKPMWFDSFYISMLSSKYKTGETNLFGACWTGFRSNIRALGNVKKCSSVIYIIRKT